MIINIFESAALQMASTIIVTAFSVMVPLAMASDAQRKTIARWTKTMAFSILVFVLVFAAAIQAINFLMGDGPPSRLEVFTLILALATAYLWVKEWFKSRIAAVRAEGLKELTDRLEAIRNTK